MYSAGEPARLRARARRAVQGGTQPTLHSVHAREEGAEDLGHASISLCDEGLDLREKMELHPKSVLWQVKLGL